MDTAQRPRLYDRATATGLRKLTPPMLSTINQADRYRPSAALNPSKALAAFKAAAPHLGLRPTLVHAVDWLFRFTNPQDWEPTSRPIVWPSASMQQQEMGLGPSQVKNLNRSLVELGLVVMRDSPNGKRYGRRNAEGHIAEAYGFDLSPIARRFEEFRALAKAARKERERIQALKRRTSIARNGIRQILETAREQGIEGTDWDACINAAVFASHGIASHQHSSEMEMAVAKLERVQADLRERLEALLIPRQSDQQKGDAGQIPVDIFVDIGPNRPENRPRITTTNHPFEQKDTVIAYEECSTQPPPSVPRRASAGSQDQAKPRVTVRRAAIRGGARQTAERRDLTLTLTPAELIRLAPRLKTYLAGPTPTWPQIVDAADWLRDELGISKSIWGDACVAMGREFSAVVVAIVSAKPSTHFRESPGAYFHGMISRAKAGELHLSKTIWGLRNAAGQGIGRPH